MNEHIDAYGSFNIYQTPEGKYFAVEIDTGEITKLFDTVESLQHSINKYLNMPQ